MTPDELSDVTIDTILKSAALVYFDGRLTEAAIKLAKCAKQRHIPILVEAERLRPNLEALLLLADFVVTSKHFPQVNGLRVLRLVASLTSSTPDTLHKPRANEIDDLRALHDAMLL